MQKSSERHSGRAVLYALGILLGLILASFLLARALNLTASHHQVVHNAFYLQIAILLSSLNMVLLAYLLFKYLKVYFSAPTNFTIGLILLTVTLLAHAIISNPLFYSNLGFSAMSGPFAFIPLIFTLLAAIVLIYLARQ